MSIASFLFYMTEHHLSLEAGALGAGYEVLKAAAGDPKLMSLVKRFQSGDQTVMPDLMAQIMRHSDAVSALTGEINAIAQTGKTDPKLIDELESVLKGQ